MSNAIENYNSPTVVERFRRQAIYVWIAALTAVSFWILIITLAPVVEANNYLVVSTPVYKFFSYICHQIPERSLHLENHALAVCSRCFGVYCGLFFGLILYPFFRPLDEVEPLPRVWLFLSLIPMAVDWSLGFFAVWNNTHLSRFSTGAIVGVACAVYIIPALVEFVRLTVLKK